MVRTDNSALPASPSDGAPILAAVDFSPDSEAALIWAGRYADEVGAELLVLHVVHDPADAPGYYRRKDTDFLRPMEDVALEMLKEFVHRVCEQHVEIGALQGAELVVISGLPASRIVEFAELHKARCIVMGSRGRTGLPHLLLGSKAERVVQLSLLPVTIVKARKPDACD